MNETLYSQALADLLPRLLPEMVLALTACVVFIGGAWQPHEIFARTREDLGANPET